MHLPKPEKDHEFYVKIVGDFHCEPTVELAGLISVCAHPEGSMVCHADQLWLMEVRSHSSFAEVGSKAQLIVQDER
ncbi:unnamed protein product [Hymenolepis diminuta]|uniref:Pirin_C_2 domain-containing protein n=1 Tax=Hymenolepis diminuta TaxID=6216 RepID=A0A0R3SKW3_HYMDI|nr:unnamed protein product [Hymenolepis diminuta]